MKRTLRIYGELWRVQTINYCRDSVNIVLGIVLTTVTMLCWVAFKPMLPGGISTDQFVLASAIGISIIRNSQYNFDLTICDWREKKLFNRLAQTPISKRTMMISILTFNWFINIIVGLWLFGLAMIFQNQREILGNVQWGQFILGFALNIVVSNAMALFAVVLLKNKALVLVISLLSYFLPMYLLGLGIPWNIVGNYSGLNIFLYIFPHRYPLALMQAAWVGCAHAGSMPYPIPNTIPQFLTGGGINPDWTAWNNSWLGVHGFGFGAHGGWYVPVLVSCGWILFFGLGIYLVLRAQYSYGQKRYKQYRGIQKHLHYISQIKRVKSVEELNALMLHINESDASRAKQAWFKANAKRAKDESMKQIEQKESNNDF